MSLHPTASAQASEPLSSSSSIGQSQYGWLIPTLALLMGAAFPIGLRLWASGGRAVGRSVAEPPMFA